MTLIFTSYFSGIEGMVMSEWAEDKLRASESLFSKTYLVTSIGCSEEFRKNVKVVRVPSISWIDFKWELAEMRKHRERLQIRILMWIPIAATLGRTWDVLFGRISKNSAARWSWAFTALPAVLLLRIKYPKSVMFSTGGATGGHLLGLFANLITRVPLYLEFQDPLMGSEMKRSDLNSKWILKLEKAFISRSSRTVFVTKKAAELVVGRHPNLSSRIYSIYPGAWNFLSSKESNKDIESENIEFLHLGTLYGSRNLDNFFLALDDLRNIGYKHAERIKIKNLGDVYLENKSSYFDRPDFELLPPRRRSQALQRAVQADVLLLVQHADTRSSETIPYKTFDYLNLKKPIFGITNNPELEGLLDSRLHVLADATSVGSIQQNLMRFLNEYDLSAKLEASSISAFQIDKQFAKIFE